MRADDNGFTDGEGVWSCPPDAGDKSCETFREATEAIKPGTPGRARYKPLKPSRRECRLLRPCLWSLPPAFLVAGGPWVRPAPGIPCALCTFEGHDDASPRAGPAAGWHALVPHLVIARSEATKQSIAPLAARWIASLRSQ